MRIPDGAPIPVRTPAEMALVLEALGEQPYLGEIQRDADGQLTWRPLLAPEAAPHRFAVTDAFADRGALGDGRSPVLDPRDLYLRAVAALGSASMKPDLLGVALVERSLAALALAAACREQLRRFLPDGASAVPTSAFHDAPSDSAPFTRAQLDADDATLATLTSTFRAARAMLGAPPTAASLAYGPGTYQLPADAPPLAPPPYPVSHLAEMMHPYASPRPARTAACATTAWCGSMTDGCGSPSRGVMRGSSPAEPAAAL